jgi:hypothetical protein
MNIHEQIEFLEGEVSLLRTKSVLEDNPLRKLGYEQNIQETLKVLSVIKESLNNSPKETNEKKENIKSINTTAPSNKPNRITNSNNNTSNDWYKKPIGMVGIAVVSTVLGVLAVYLLREYLGIPL